MIQVHVTSTSNGVHGHEVAHCDESGCNGRALFFKGVDSTSVEVGSVYELRETDAGYEVVSQVC